ncbi:MAG: hypothetical protein ACJ8AH_21230 [Stellaceae bacterium]
MVTQAILALSWATVLGLVAALIFSGVVKGVLGVGLPLILVPLNTQFLDVPVAVALLTVPMIATNIGQALEGGRTRRGSDEWAHAADENLSRRPARVPTGCLHLIPLPAIISGKTPQRWPTP